jgi:peptidoglycan hydrolase CwlO-like protein
MNITKEMWDKMQKDMAEMKSKVDQLTGRVNRMYKGWGDTKSDLAKLKIRLVQRDDLQRR